MHSSLLFSLFSTLLFGHTLVCKHVVLPTVRILTICEILSFALGVSNFI